MRPLVAVFAIIVMQVWAYAQTPSSIDGFVVWQPVPGGVRYLIPKVPGETPSQTAERWQRSMKSSAAYRHMENVRDVVLSTDPSRFSELPPSTEAHPRVAVILNRPKQMTEQSKYLPKAIAAFEKHGPDLYAMPIGLETALTTSQMADVRKKLNDFDGQLGVGGDDTHPSLWRQADRSHLEGDISWRRDIQQSAYMREYLKNGKGRVFYICGSMQRAAVISGYGLHTDIAHITTTPHRQTGEKPLMLEVVVDSDSELAIAAGSNRFETSNYHHAGVNSDIRLSDKPLANITAYNIEPDGSRGRVVKAIEFEKNAGFATQFHPEFEGSEAERRIVQYVATGWKLRGRYAPAEIARCLEGRLMQLMPSPAGVGESAAK